MSVIDRSCAVILSNRAAASTGALSTQTSSQRLKCLTFALSSKQHHQGDPLQITEQRVSSDPASHLTAYVMRSGLRALIMHSLWSEVLFFHSCGNFSFSGHSDSTNFFQRLAEPSMSRSRFLNSSMEHRDWWLKGGGEKKKTGKEKKYCIFKSAAPSWSVMHVKVFDHSRDISRYTAKVGTLFAEKGWRKKKRETKKRKECLSFLAPI